MFLLLLATQRLSIMIKTILNSSINVWKQEVPESVANVPVRAPRSAESILAQERAKVSLNNFTV